MSLIASSRRLVRRSGGLVDGFSRKPAAVSRFSAPANRQANVTLDGSWLDSRRDNRERVVILGSGWAGYTFARQLDSKKYQAVIISPRSYFVFTPLLASTSVGTLEFRAALEPVRSKRTKVDFFQGWADDVDFKNKTVTVEEAVEDPHQGLALTGDRHEGESSQEREQEKKVEVKKGKLFDLKYDKLVIAVGCYMQTFGTPGVRENALFLKDVGDARKIRKRILSCFETAALPTTTDEMRKYLLNFAIIGGGPTGIEFSAELHDIINEDLAKLYPELMKYYKITVYDVAPKILSMFDENLGKYAMEHFHREGIDVKTSHHVEWLRRGLPKGSHNDEVGDTQSCWTLKVKEEGELGCGMVVWSTGLMMNPFVEKTLTRLYDVHGGGVTFDKNQISDPEKVTWIVKKHPKTQALVTDDRLRLVLEPEKANGESKPHAVVKDVFALGDCAMQEEKMYPATAQVASQKAMWLAKRLSKGDLEQSKFEWKNLGVMAYLGNWNALVQSPGGAVSGRLAWLVWRGAYLTKSVSLRNKILIPLYWFLNWAFGRDISRF